MHDLIRDPADRALAERAAGPERPGYCECETPIMDAEHDAGCRRCGRPVDFTPTKPEWGYYNTEGEFIAFSGDVDYDEATGFDAAAEHGRNEHYTIRCFASGDEAEADTAEAALVAADQLARDHADAGPARNLKTTRDTLAIYLNGTWHNTLTGLARAGYRAPVTTGQTR